MDSTSGQDSKRIVISQEDLEIRSSRLIRLAECSVCGTTNSKKLKEVTSYGGCLPVNRYICKPCAKVEKVKAKQERRFLKSHCTLCESGLQKPKRKNRIKFSKLRGYENWGGYLCIACYKTKLAINPGSSLLQLKNWPEPPENESEIDDYSEERSKNLWD